MDRFDWKLEEERLLHTLKVLRDRLYEGEEDYRKIQEDLRDHLKEYWESKTADRWDEAQRAEEVDRQRGIVSSASQRRRRFAKMLSSPYFGRIDLKEAGLSISEPIYIGIGTLTEEESHQILVYDWRSPVAGVYYDFELGKVWYLSPAGRIDGFVSLKRQYRIIDGRLTMMFDSDVAIHDELLQEILGKSVNDKMRTIVTSIQREQNRIIRDEDHRWLFVEGPAGSGKTSVALHRAAYWLYHRRNTVTSKNILILSPNPIFSDYISNVLPELGEENVRRMTFANYIEELQPKVEEELETIYQQMETMLSPMDDKERQIRKESIAFKASLGFLAYIQAYASILEERWVEGYPALSFEGQCIWSASEWRQRFLRDLTYLPVQRRLAKIRREIQRRMRPLVKKERQKKAEEIAAKGEEVNEKTILILARLAARETFRPVVDLLEALTKLDTLELYRSIFSSDSAGKEVASDGLPSDWEAIRSDTWETLQRGALRYEDVVPWLYLDGLLRGFPEQKQIRHVIIDEGQDYTAFQYALLRRIFPRATWTVLGDTAQAIHPATPGAYFREAAEVLEAENPEFVRLTKSYRSTGAIQSFCRALLPGSALHDGLSRQGHLPSVTMYPSDTKMLEAIPAQIAAWRSEGWQSMAILCKTAVEAERVYRALSSKIPVAILDCETVQFKRDVVVVPSYLAKGLEFDTVLVWRADGETYHREDERRLFYMNCTRALHRLALVYSGAKTPFVETIPEELYEERVYETHR